MKFTKGQKQVLDLIEKSKGFLHLFPLMRVIIQDESPQKPFPLNDKYDLVQDCVEPYIERIQNLILNIRKFFVASHEKHSLRNAVSLSKYFKNLQPQPKLLEKLKDEILKDLKFAEVDFQWADLDKFTENDIKKGFLADAVSYYTQSVCFEDFSPEKARASLVNQVQLGKLQTLKDPNQQDCNNTFEKIQIVLRAARQNRVNHQKRITSLFKKLDDPLFDAELKQHQPTSGMQYAAPLIIITVAASLYIIYSLKDDLRFGMAASLIIGLLAKLAVWDKAVVPRLQTQQTYKGYLQQKFDRVTKEFEENTRLQRIHVIEVVKEEKIVSEVKYICIIPAQLKQLKVANDAKEEKQKVVVESDQAPHAKEPKRRNKPSAAAEVKDTPKSLVKSTNVPEEIEFTFGDSGKKFTIYPKSLPKDSPIKPIQDGTGTLWGFLDKEKLAHVEETEMVHFRNVLNNGVYVSKYVHGVGGVKQQGDHTYIYDTTAKAKEFVRSYTKLRPSAIGARVASQRFFATRVVIGGDEIANPWRYRLDCFDTYSTGKEAHRPGMK